MNGFPLLSFGYSNNFSFLFANIKKFLLFTLNWKRLGGGHKIKYFQHAPPNGGRQR
jgi:hypothetical protein